MAGIKQTGDGAKALEDFPQRLRRSLLEAAEVIGQDARDAISDNAREFALDGDLAESWTFRLVEAGDESVMVFVESDSPYAKMRDEGGTIDGDPVLAWSPDGGPLPRKTRASEVKGNAGAFGFLRTFIAPSGAAILGVRDTGARGPRGGVISSDPEVLFILAESVTQQGEGYISRVEEELERTAANRIRTILDQKLGG